MLFRWDFVWTVAAVITLHPFTFSALISKPRNTVSVVGNKTKIESSRNSHVYPVDWEFASPGSNSFSYIYTNEHITEGLSSKYKIETDGTTRYGIVIDSVDLSHAGTYKCNPITEEVINASSYTSQLIVLASDPVCNTYAIALNDSFVEGDYVRMWCTVTYAGDWIPVMEWTRSNGQTFDDNIVYTNTSTTVTSSLTVQLYSSDNGATFTCKTFFSQTSTKISRTLTTGETLATNVPDYQHLSDFKPSVLYAPRNLTIIPVKSVYEVGDRLECWADGDPTPTYEWMENETNRTIIRGSVLTINDQMRSDKNHSFSCTAYNSVAGIKRQTAVTVTVTVTASPSATDQYLIISLMVIAAVCCLVFTLYLCNNRCPYKRDTAESAEDQPAVRLRAPQAAHQVGAEDGNLQQPLPFPVYSEVQRQEKNDELRSVAEGSTGYLQEHRGLPVYTEVVKNRNELKNSKEPRQTAEATTTPYRSPKTLTGADGTQYLDVTSLRDQISRSPIRHPPMFSQVETYASIDHTVHAPPFLLPKRHH